MSDSLFEYLGVIGGILFFIKVGLHIFLKSLSTNKYNPGAAGFLRFELFLPVFDDVEKGAYVFKKVINIIYLTAIILISIFLIARFLNR